jgi:hypothetical protein
LVLTLRISGKGYGVDNLEFGRHATKPFGDQTRVLWIVSFLTSIYWPLECNSRFWMYFTLQLTSSVNNKLLIFNVILMPPLRFSLILRMENNEQRLYWLLTQFFKKITWKNFLTLNIGYFWSRLAMLLVIEFHFYVW